MDQKGKVVGHIAYNGKVFPGEHWKSGDKPIFNPYHDKGEQVKATPENKTVTQMPTNTLTKLESVESERSSRARGIDRAKKHSLVINNTDPKTTKWIKDPGSMDIVGIDAPAGSKPTPKKEKPKVTYQKGKITISESEDEKPKEHKPSNNPKSRRQQTKSHVIELGAGVVRSRHRQHIKLY